MSNNTGTEKLTLLGTGLMTAQALHILMNIAALPGIFARDSVGFAGTVQTGALAVWTIAGVAAGIFLTVRAIGFFNGSSYRNAKVAAAGSLALPLLGTSGAVTAFALIPIGLLAWVLLRQPEWQTLFRDGVELQVPENELEELTPSTEEEPEYAETR